MSAPPVQQMRSAVCLLSHCDPNHLQQQPRRGSDDPDHVVQLTDGLTCLAQGLQPRPLPLARMYLMMSLPVPAVQGLAAGASDASALPADGDAAASGVGEALR